MPDHLLLGGETDDHNRWPNMSLDSALEVIPAVADSRAKHGRSKSTNHRDLLPRIKDGRSTQARRFRDLVHAFISEVASTT